MDKSVVANVMKLAVYLLDNPIDVFSFKNFIHNLNSELDTLTKWHFSQV